MNKLARMVLIVILSKWFTALFFFGGTFISMEAICAMSGCSRDISAAHEPPSFFTVMVRLPSEENKVVPVVLPELERYLSNHPEATLIMLGETGRSASTTWAWTAKNEGKGTQIIKALTKEDNRIDVTYRAAGRSAQPLHIEYRAPGMLFSALAFMGVITFLLGRLRERWSRDKSVVNLLNTG